ncbi:MAG TPA: CHAT domain-containing tetratricopeptide repeat protein [Pyrinomonadaceae bacterium]|nr:CHAT domain-containing tetratricopeptide repeat protein [Pyrinomonadaceae bacterium]
MRLLGSTKRSVRTQKRLLLVALLLIIPATSIAQTNTNSPTPSPANPNNARIDQLITECRELMMKGTFEGIAQKGEEALKLSRETGDKLRQARSLMYIALGVFHTGQTEEAIEPFKQSAALAGEAGDKLLQTRALNAAGVLLEEAGQLEDALYFFNQSLNLAQELKDRPNEATALRNIGRIHIANRDYAEANEIVQRSLAIARELQDAGLEHSALDTLSSLENGRRNFAQALNYETQSHHTEGGKVSPTAKYQILTVEAITLYELGEFEKCDQVLRRALDFARTQKIAPAEATVLGNLADLQLKQGKYSDALISASQALDLLRRVGGDPAHEAAVLYSLAQAQRQTGKPDEALANLRQGIALLERARLATVPTEAARAQLVSKNTRIFAETVALLLDRGLIADALTISESYHGRAFLDSLVESHADLRQILPKELLKQEGEIHDRISNIQRALWQGGISPEREQLLKKDLADAEDALAGFQLQVRHANPQYANLKHLAPLTEQRIQREVLQPGTALIEYFVGEDKSFAWLVSNEKISYAVMPAGKELQRQVTDYRKLIAEKSADGRKQSADGFAAQSRQLYHVLIQPFEHDLSSIRDLIIVPDGALTYVPFETLLADAGALAKNMEAPFLLERFAITYAPSASALAAIRTGGSASAARGLLAFGDPVYYDSENEPERAPDKSANPISRAYMERGLDLRRLPYTRTEVNDIAGLFPSADRKVFLGADANEKNVKSERLDNFRYVHFATHGIVDEEKPARSGVILSLKGNEKEDGVLQVTEIMRLKLNADVVTLSACRTGMGRIIGGEGVLGLTRAFLYAGSRSVVASLWNVNDTATAELMKSFYANLRKGEPKDEALRQAKLTLLKGKQTTWRHPYYWAPFVLVGANN